MVRTAGRKERLKIKGRMSSRHPPFCVFGN
nr:MAG TPA: hypothetical protein [Caudoviricetes sp.]